MKHFLISLFALFCSMQAGFAADSSILGIDDSKLRKGEVDLNDIPGAIKSAIDFFLSIAGTIAVIFIIIGAYKILFGSLQQDKTKGRDTIIAALGGFALAALAWVIIKTLLVNLG